MCIFWHITRPTNMYPLSRELSRNQVICDIAAERVSKAIKAGIVWVNTFRVISPVAEFGGMKTFGYGRESGFQAVLDYTRPQAVWMYTSSELLVCQFHSRQGKKMIRQSVACVVKIYNVITRQKMPNYAITTSSRVRS